MSSSTDWVSENSVHRKPSFREYPFSAARDRGRRSLTLRFLAHDHHGTVGVSTDAVRDAPQQEPSQPAHPPTAHHYEPGLYLIGKANDLLNGRPYLHMSLGYGTSSILDLLDLGIQELSPHGFFN